MKAAAATNCMRLLVLLIHAPAHQVDGHRLQQPAAAAAATSCLAALRSTSGPETDCGPPDHCDACRVAAAIAAGCSQGEVRAFCTPAPRARRAPLRDDFSSGLNGSDWMYMNRWWDRGSGGVVKDNVCVGQRSAGEAAKQALRLSANGDAYTGPVDGCFKQGGKYPKCATRGAACPTKVGAGVTTRDYYGPSLFCARVTVFPVVGVSSALWTFHYWGDGRKEKQDELDIEFPGRTTAGKAQAPGNALVRCNGAACVLVPSSLPLPCFVPK